MRTAVAVAALTFASLVFVADPNARASADPLEPGVDEAFVLGGGQDATISGADLHLRFDDVLEDSRCPALAACFWSGQARVAVVATPATGVPATVVFNTNPAPGQTVSVIPVGDYAVELISLDPYPQTPYDGIDLGQYRATLAVHER